MKRFCQNILLVAISVVALEGFRFDDNGGYDMDRAVHVMAQTLWGEARGEKDPEFAMMAVGSVIMNRLQHPGRWSNKVEDVVLQSKQFSCWNEGDPNLPLMQRVTDTDPQFQMARQIAEDMLKGRKAPLFNATYFHTCQVKPRWAKGQTPVQTIGNHTFYELQRP